MIQFQFFPRSRGVTEDIQKVINCFKTIENEIDLRHTTLFQMMS